MRKALSYMAIGGALVAVGLYLFPMYAGQEIFIGWLSETSGQGYWYGVFLAMLISGLILLAGYFLIRPSAIGLLRNPMVLAIVVVLLVLTIAYLIPFITGLIGGGA